MASSEPNPCEAAVQHHSIHGTELGVAPSFELFHFIGNKHFDCFGQFFLEQPFIETHLLKDGFDVFKHRKHEESVDWLKKQTNGDENLKIRYSLHMKK